VLRFYYYGCRGTEKGHYIHGENGRHYADTLDVGFPGWLLDGTFAPLDQNDCHWKLTQLNARYSHVLSILACHDNTIDSRPGSNAAFVVLDTVAWDEEHILAEMRGRFPDCWERLDSIGLRRGR
jgi:hypothetical protein